MANVKISELPVVTSVTNSDVLPVVATTTTSKLTIKDLANSLPQVTSSISASLATTASYVLNAVSASYAPSTPINTSSFATTGSNNFDGNQTVTGSLIANNLNVKSNLYPFGGFEVLAGTNASSVSIGKYGESGQLVMEVAGDTGLNNYPNFTFYAPTDGISFIPNVTKGVQVTGSLKVSGGITGSLLGTASFAVSASWAPTTPAFPFTGSAQITGSLGVTGSVSIMSSSISLLSSSFQTSVVVGNNKGLIANYIYPVNYYNFDWNDPTISATDQPGFPHFYPAGTNPGFQGYSGVNYYFADVNIGQSINANKAGVVKLLRDTTTNLPDVEYFTLVSNGNNVSDFVTSFRTANGRNHTLTVTGSLLARDGVTLGTNIQNQHYLTGSLTATGSLKVTGSLAIDTSGSFILPGTASANPVAGNFYFDFTNNKLYAYNGSNWVTASLGI